jgi:hypothetical protein
MAMQVQGKGGPLFGVITWLVVGICFLVIAIMTSESAIMLWLAGPAFIMCAILLFTRERASSFELTDEGIEFHDPDLSVAYSEIEGLVAVKRGESNQFPIAVFHSGGCRTTGSRLVPSSRRVFSAICPYLEEGGHRDVPEMLESIRDELVTKFGKERVFCYRGRSWKTPGARKPLMWFFISMFLLSILLFGLIGLTEKERKKNKEGEPVLATAAVLLFLTGVIGSLVCVSRSRWSVKPHPNYGMIISPLGLALIQGKVRGEMEWDELLKVIYPLKPGSFRMQRLPIPGIGLKVEGSAIGIGDFYDRPLSMIHRRILDYWKEPPGIDE